MKLKLKQHMLLSVLAAGLVLAPLPGLPPYQASAAASTAASQSSAISVFVDGTKLILSPPPIVANGTTLVPMREIFTALNAKVSWEPQTKTIIASKGYTKISLQIGAKQAFKNGKAVKLDVPARQTNGATFVPLRFVAEALDAEVSIDTKTKIIRITSAEKLYAARAEAQRKAEESRKAAKQKLTTSELVELNDEKVVMITTNRGQGSGIVIGTNRILTNFHVIADAAEAMVLTIDGDSLEVEGVVAYDEESDLAIIQTKQEIGYDPVVLGSGYDVQKGDHVVAIGSPLGMQNTVSEGIISNIYYDAYQISVPIDHGSSGGALFNVYGELVGVTSSGSDISTADLNFAIPVDYVHSLLLDSMMEPSEKVAFLPSRLPDTLVGSSVDDIRKLMEGEFGIIPTSQGQTELKRWNVTRDAKSGLLITAVIDPSFYMLYGHFTADELRYWAVDAGAELRRMLPEDQIQLVVYYEQVFNFEPRGFKADEVTNLGDGTWRLRYPVIDMQEKDKMHVQVRA
ncbi:stalk domain-containing protein [Paenibacillus spongiae]|uniref:Trypsin-like peptidase domain-containing protein n=1 Tax=Paenibacillus spongiae TaxID=2909671 RepID=A0ABY5SGT0_9BACL|nr:stalk domain-containing protein [Paenibacillus spongiae]UVI31468.1 trypsin-like peptidase domain-containing protein [Paenibacillus spongiae]